MAHTISTRARARLDLQQRMAWLATNRNAGVAGRWLAKYDAAIAALEEDPNRYPEADEVGDLGFSLREFVFKQGKAGYRILFTINGDTVNVLRVRHAAQDRLTDADL
jgi:plasmid stabilization system protein ParE